jgi:hypothetical protein
MHRPTVYGQPSGPPMAGIFINATSGCQMPGNRIRLRSLFSKFSCLQCHHFGFLKTLSAKPYFENNLFFQKMWTEDIVCSSLEMVEFLKNLNIINY